MENNTPAQDYQQEEKVHSGTFSIIPFYIDDDPDLEDGAKLLYGTLLRLSAEGRCWASNKYLAEKRRVSDRTIQRWLKSLSDKGHIEIEVEQGTYNTRRDIWIIVNFKNENMTRQKCHPPTTKGGVTKMSYPLDKNVVHTNNINKYKEQQQQTRVRETPEQLRAAPAAAVSSANKSATAQALKPKIYQCLEPEDFPDPEKIAMTQSYPEDQVKKALSFTNAQKSYKNSKIACLKWACAQKDLPENKETIIEKNKHLAQTIERDLYGKTPDLVVNALNSGFEIGVVTTGGIPQFLNYASQNFREQIKEFLDKYFFYQKTGFKYSLPTT